MNFLKVRSRFLLLIILAVFNVHWLGAAGYARPFFAPQRLRLRVDSNTLRSGEATKVYVEFLDRDYQQVPNDRARVIEFQQASAGSQQTGSGRFSPPRLTVSAGAWSGEATFVSEDPGKLLLVAASDGMESAQLLLLISRQSTPLLSRLLKTVAYAAEGVEILPKENRPAVANDKSPATFFVSLYEPPADSVTIRVITSPAAKILYGEKEFFAFADVKLDQTKAVSDPINIVSPDPGRIAISAFVFPHGPKDTAELEFIPRRPARIIFDRDPSSIDSSQSCVPISLQLADDDGFPVEPDRERHIGLSSATDSGTIRFESDSVVMSPGQPSVHTTFRLLDLPSGSELKLLAVASDDGSLRAGEKSILIKSPIEKILVSGPIEVNRGRKKVKFTVRLADRNGSPVVADWKRKIDLSVDGGRLSLAHAIIEKGQDSAEVTYSSPNSVGKFTLTAESSGLESGKLVLRVITPEYWLILFALLGGVIGGVARQLHKDARFENIRPRRIGDTLEFGLLGRIACSVIGGLFFYWTVKLGLSQALGIPVLPATLNLGTKTVAIVFGGVGGFAGTAVLDRLVAWFLPGKSQQTAPVQHTGSVAQ